MEISMMGGVEVMRYQDGHNLSLYVYANSHGVR